MSTGVGPGPGAELSARWVAGEIGKVVARFSNPLRVPLELQRVEAVLDGSPRVQVFPTRVVLPPKAEFYEVRDWVYIGCVHSSVRDVSSGSLLSGMEGKKREEMHNLMTSYEGSCVIYMYL